MDSRTGSEASALACKCSLVAFTFRLIRVWEVEVAQQMMLVPQNKAGDCVKSIYVFVMSCNGVWMRFIIYFC